MNKETTVDDWVRFIEKEVCSKCAFYIDSLGMWWRNLTNRLCYNAKSCT